MTTVKGLFAPVTPPAPRRHKFSSGSHAEGRIAGKAAIRYIVNEKPATPKVDDATIEKLQGRDPASRSTIFEENKGKTTQTRRQPELHPAEDVHVCACRRSWTSTPAACRAQFTTTKPLLDRGLELLDLPQGRLREARRRGPARADALLGERPPHVAGRGPRPHDALPRGDPLAGLLLPRRHPEAWTRRTGSCFVNCKLRSRRPTSGR